MDGRQLPFASGSFLLPDRRFQVRLRDAIVRPDRAIHVRLAGEVAHGEAGDSDGHQAE